MNNDLKKTEELISWIEKQDFSLSLEGYDVNEIDNFMNHLVSWVRMLESNNMDLKKRILELEQEITNKNMQNAKNEFEIQRYKTIIKQLEKVNESRK
ncbi:MAG0865 family DivIVA-related protein [Mycoplasmopsis edwardii]|nr:DivIVA domain-containing protein [Mycoplasmopsis edwardii]